MNVCKLGVQEKGKRQVLLICSLAFLLGVTLVMFSVPGFALMKGNGSTDGFGGDEPTGGESIGMSGFNTAVIESACYSMESQSQILLFPADIERSEMTGPDYKKMSQTLRTAITKMEKAESVYLQLRQQSDQTPYNQQVISQLTMFDYVGLFDVRNDKQARGLAFRADRFKI